MKGLVHYSRMGLLNKSFIYIYILYTYTYIYISLYTCTAHQWPNNLKYIFWQFCRSSRAIATKVPCTAPKLLNWIPLNSPRWTHQDPTNYQIKKFQHGSNLGFQRTIKVCEFVILQNRIMMPIDIFFQQRGGSTSKPRAFKPKKWRCLQYLAISYSTLDFSRWVAESFEVIWGILWDPEGSSYQSLPSPCAVPFGCQNARSGVRRYWQDGEDGEPVADLATSLQKWALEDDTRPGKHRKSYWKWP